VAGFDVLKGMRDFRPAPDDFRPRKWRVGPIDGDHNGHHLQGEVGADPIERKGIRFPIENDNTWLSADGDLPAVDNVPRAIDAAGLGVTRHDPTGGQDRLDLIANVLRTLTYGEMLELAESMWKANPERSGLTESELPKVLHRWSTSRQP